MYWHGKRTHSLFITKFISWIIYTTDRLKSCGLLFPHYWIPLNYFRVFSSFPDRIIMCIGRNSLVYYQLYTNTQSILCYYEESIQLSLVKMCRYINHSFFTALNTSEWTHNYFVLLWSKTYILLTAGTLSPILFVPCERNVDFSTHSLTHSIYGLHNFSAFLQYFTAVNLKISSPDITYVFGLMLKTLKKPQVGIKASDMHFKRLNSNNKMSRLLLT